MELYKSKKQKGAEIYKHLKMSIFMFFSKGVEEAAMWTIIYVCLLLFEGISILLPIYTLSVIEVPSEWSIWGAKVIIYANNLLLFHIQGANNLIWILHIFIFLIFTGLLSTLIYYGVLISNSKRERIEGSTGNNILDKICKRANVIIFYFLLIIEKSVLIWVTWLLQGILNHTTRGTVNEDSNSKYEIEFSTIQMTDEGSIEYYFMYILSILCIFILFSLSILSISFSLSPRPDCTPWSHQNIPSSLLKLGVKIYLSSAVIWDPTYTNLPSRVLPTVFAMAVLVGYKLISPPNQSYISAYINAGADTLILCIYIGGLLATFMGLHSFFNFLIGLAYGGFLASASLFLYIYRRKRILEKAMRKFTSSSLSYEAMLMLIQTLSRGDKENILGVFCSMGYLHSTHCPLPECKARGIMQTLRNTENINELTNLLAQSSANTNSLLPFFIKRSDIPDNLNNTVADTVIHQFITATLQLLTSKYPRVMKIRLLLVYYNLYILGHSFGALKELSLAERYKSSLRNQFEIFYYKTMIEQFHFRGFTQAKRYIFDHIDTLQVLQFSSGYNSCIFIMKEISEISSNFWSYLLNEENANGYRLANLGKQLITKKRELHKESKFLLGDFGYNLHFLYKFMIFQQKVLHNEQFSYVLFNKIKILSENNKVQRGNKILTSNSKQLLVKISGERQYLGQILDISVDCNYFLEYQKEELIGENINILLPPILAQNHNKYIEHFLETMEFKYLNSSIISYIRQKSGFYMSALILTKVLPRFHDSQFGFFGIMKEIKTVPKIGITKLSFSRSPMIFLSDEQNTIIGINTACSKQLKLTLNLSENTSAIVLSDIFPHFLDERFEINLLNNQGIIFSFNTRGIPHDIISERIQCSRRKILLWGRLVKFVAGNIETGLVCIKILTICWISDDYELDKLNSIIKGTYSKSEEQKEEKLLDEQLQLPNFADQGSIIGSTWEAGQSQSTSTISQRRYVLAYKKDRDERGYTNFLRKFKFYVIISVLVLIILNIIGFFIIRVKMNNNESHMKILLDYTKRMDNIIMLNNQILDITAGFLFLYETEDKQLIEDLYAYRRVTTTAVVGLLKESHGYLQKLAGNLPKVIQDLEYSQHKLKYMNSDDTTTETSYSLSTYIDLMLGANLGLIVPDIIYPIIQDCRTYATLYGCKYMRSLYYVYMNIYHYLRIDLDLILTKYIDEFLAESYSEEITVLLLVSSAMIFSTISCFVIIINTYQVSKRKANLLGAFAYIPSEQINLILENIYNLDLNTLWYSGDFANDPDYIFNLNQIPKEDQEERKEGNENNNSLPQFIKSQEMSCGPLDKSIVNTQKVQTDDNSLNTTFTPFIQKGDKGAVVNIGFPLPKINLDQINEDISEIHRFSQKNVNLEKTEENYSESLSELNYNLNKHSKELTKFEMQEIYTNEEKGSQGKIEENKDLETFSKKEEGSKVEFVYKLNELHSDLEGIREELNKYGNERHKNLVKLDNSLLKRISLRVMMAAILWMIVFVLHVTLIVTFYKAFEESSSIFKSIARSRSYLSALNHIVWIGMLQNDTNDMIRENKEKYSFEYYLKESFTFQSKMTRIIKSNPSGLKKFTNLLQDLDSEKFLDILETHTTYTKQNGDNYDCRTGMNSIAENGLQTSISGFLNINIKFRDSIVNSNRTSLELSKEWLDDEHYGCYLFGIYCISPAITYKLELFMAELEKYFEYSLLLESFHLVGMIFLCVLIYFCILSRIIIILQKELCDTEEMTNLIPLQVILESKEMLDQFIPEKDKVIYTK